MVLGQAGLSQDPRGTQAVQEAEEDEQWAPGMETRGEEVLDDDIGGDQRLDGARRQRDRSRRPQGQGDRMREGKAPTRQRSGFRRGERERPRHEEDAVQAQGQHGGQQDREDAHEAADRLIGFQ